MTFLPYDSVLLWIVYSHLAHHPKAFHITAGKSTSQLWKTFCDLGQAVFKIQTLKGNTFAWSKIKQGETSLTLSPVPIQRSIHPPSTLWLLFIVSYKPFQISFMQMWANTSILILSSLYKWWKFRQFYVLPFLFNSASWTYFILVQRKFLRSVLFWYGGELLTLFYP